MVFNGIPQLAFFFSSELNIVRFYTLEIRIRCIAQLCTGVAAV